MARRLPLQERMLKVQRAANGHVVFTLSGRIDAERVAELEELLNSEAKGRPIIVDLKDVTLVSREAVMFLVRCEADSVTLANCPVYIREWIIRERGGKSAGEVDSEDTAEKA